MAEQDGLAPMDASEPCPHDCPCGAEREADFSQQEPSRLIGEVDKAEGFTRKNKNGREADRRLANRRRPHRMVQSRYRKDKATAGGRAASGLSRIKIGASG